MTPLSSDVGKMIRSSCKPLLERQEWFHGEFHQSLAELMPDVPLMHEPSGEQVSRRLAECVLWAVFADEPLPMIGATLQGIGLDVYRLGFPRSGYQAVGHALLRTLRATYPADWSGSLSSAWIGYHSWLCEYWLSGAEIGAFEAQTRPVEPPSAPYQPPPEATGTDLEADEADEDDEEDGLSYGEIMVSMTLGANRSSRRRAES
jgi:hemoglobin-like flavoprotein